MGKSGPASGASIVTAARTDPGRVRDSNQDAVGEFRHALADRRLLIVADGMGGPAGGDVASKLVVQSVENTFRSSQDDAPDLLRRALERANEAVLEVSRKNLELAGMGTTAVVLLFEGSLAGWVAHVGDSRAYRLRDGELSQLTRDHSVVEELIALGQISRDQARTHPQRSELLRSLGTEPAVEVELAPVDVRPGDLFLLCSDGLTKMVSEQEIARRLCGSDPERAVRELIELANAAGGQDNVTVQIAAIPGSNASRGRSRARGSRARFLLIGVGGLFALALLGWAVASL